MGRMTKARIEGGNGQGELPAIVEQAKALAGAKWGEVRTWPLESGLVWLAEKLKG